MRKTASPRRQSLKMAVKTVNGTKGVHRSSAKSVRRLLESCFEISHPSFFGEWSESAAKRPNTSNPKPTSIGRRMSYSARNGSQMMSQTERSETSPLIAEDSFLYSDFRPISAKRSRKYEDPVPLENASPPKAFKTAPSANPQNPSARRNDPDEAMRRSLVKTIVRLYPNRSANMPAGTLKRNEAKYPAAV